MDKFRAFFEELAQEWDGSQPEDREQIVNKLLTPFDDCFLSCHKILEVGTGTGALIPIMTTRYPGIKIISIDLAYQMLCRAKKRVPDSTLVQCDVHFTPFPPQCFDAVICHNSFPHFLSKNQALLILNRVLINRGKLLIFHDLSRQRVNEIHRNAENPVIHQDILPDKHKMAKLLLNSGFTPEKLMDNDAFYVAYAKKTE